MHALFNEITRWNGFLTICAFLLYLNLGLFPFLSQYKSNIGNEPLESVKAHLAYRRVNMFTISNNDKGRCMLWKEEAIIGLKNAVKLKA